MTNKRIPAGSTIVFKVPRNVAVDGLQMPKDFDRETANIWQRVVVSRPVGFYDAADVDLLVRYCRLEVRIRRIEEQLDDDPQLTPRYVQLNKLLISMARALRISKISVIAPDSTANKKRSAHREWLKDGE